MYYPTIDSLIGNTPLVRLQRLAHNPFGNIVLAKLEGNNPAGSVKDRAAFSMLVGAEMEGRIKPGDTLIEATSGNTGIALAMVAAIRGYKMILLMPENLSVERQKSMTAYGAKLILTPREGGMEEARDRALQMEREGQGVILNQFSNPRNPRAHIQGTAPEIWRDTAGRVSHFVSSMGTTGTITGCGRFFKDKNQAIQVVGVQPKEGASIPGIRKWGVNYLPEIYDPSVIDSIVEIGQEEAENCCRSLAKEEGIFAGVSSGGAAAVALQLALTQRNATIVFIVCDRGDRYLSTGVF